MKKILGVIFITLPILFSCNQRNTINPTSKVEVFVDTFLKNRPDWDNNNFTRDNAINACDREFYDFAFKHKNIIYGIPFKFKDINYNDGKNIAFFKSQFPSQESAISIIDSLNLDILGIVSDQVARELNDSSNYYIYGLCTGFFVEKEYGDKFYGKTIKDNDTSNYNCYILTKGNNRLLNINLGTWIVQIDSVKLINN